MERQILKFLVLRVNPTDLVTQGLVQNQNNTVIRLLLKYCHQLVDPYKILSHAHFLYSCQYLYQKIDDHHDSKRG